MTAVAGVRPLRRGGGSVRSFGLGHWRRVQCVQLLDLDCLPLCLGLGLGVCDALWCGALLTFSCEPMRVLALHICICRNVWSAVLASRLPLCLSWSGVCSVLVRTCSPSPGSY